MEKFYLIVFQSSTIDRDDLIKYLEKTPGITFWMYNLQNTLFVKWTGTAQDISNSIVQKYGNIIHIVIEVKNNYWGSLPSDHWTYFPKP